MKGNKKSVWMGNGKIPRTIILLFVSGLLILNLSSLVLSIKPVTQGVMQDFSSRTWGEVKLPYVPMTPDDVEFFTDRDPVVGAPFQIRIFFHEGKLPYIQHRLLLSGNGTDIFFPMWQSSARGNPCLLSYTNGLPDAGTWAVLLERDLENVTDRIRIGEIEVRDTTGGPGFPFPSGFVSEISGDGLEMDLSLVEDGELEFFYLHINGGPSVDVSILSEKGQLFISNRYFDPGWNELEVIRDPGNGSNLERKYLLLNEEGGIPPFDHGPITFRRVFEGSDDLYGQKPDHWFETPPESVVELYQNVFYMVNFSFDQGGPNSNLSGCPACSISLTIDGSTYPLILVDQGSYQGIFRAPFSLEDGDRIVFMCTFPFAGYVLEEIEVDLRKDRASIMDIDPDPFDLAFFQNEMPDEVQVRLYAEWADFNRRDFKDTPLVVMGNITLEPQEEEGLFLHEMNYSLDRESFLSGETLFISSDTVFEFGTIVTFLLPGPRILYYIPIPLEGYIALVWFIMVALAIFISIPLLFIQSTGILEKGKKGERRWDMGRASRNFSDQDSPIMITVKTFTGAIFFFFMTIWMFSLLETPTPGLDILSSETPIWMRMFTLAEASVWEEITGRMILIGIPLSVLYLARGNGPRSFKALIGGTGKFGSIEMFLILLSGSLFGIAHLGWGPWKVLPTFVHGLMFGYLFLKVGLHASIAMHFLFDYTNFFTQITGSFNWVFIFFFFAMLVLGGLYLGDIVRKIQLWVSARTSKRFERPELLLVIHSLLSLWFAYLLISDSKSMYLVPFLMSVPIIDAVAYAIASPWAVGYVEKMFDPISRVGYSGSEVIERKTGLKIEVVVVWIGKMLCYMISYLSLAGSAFGFGWVVSNGHKRYHR
ncbi:MAG: CPBP family intramembrane glutamic endopeptidase [Candidatus Thermoplasmatota archaeon]|nr:CPBP family intramembrane glutamic endopeptidase [Candidatus Thermoplasmatota archaeon]